MPSLPLSATLLAACMAVAVGCKSSSPTPDPGPVVTTPVCSAQGWASQNGGTTGGGAATPTVVTTYDQLKAALINSSVKVVQVDGTIAIPAGGRITLQDQQGKTIFGSAGAQLTSADQTQASSGILYVKRCSNLLIRNLVFDGPGAYDTDGYDDLTLETCTNVWVDHCEFRDGLDGNLDINKASDFITVSWTKFTYLKAPRAGGPGGSSDHRFSNLIGSSDTDTGDRGKLNITFARCWWGPGCVGRMPRVRFGKVHVVNSYFNSTASSSCVQAGFEANLLIQANSFEGVKNPIAPYGGSTAIQETGNLYTSTTGTRAGDGNTAFTPPYSLTVLAAADVKATVTASTGAGATLTSNACSGSGI